MGVKDWGLAIDVMGGWGAELLEHERHDRRVPQIACARYVTGGAWRKACTRVDSEGTIMKRIVLGLAAVSLFADLGCKTTDEKRADYHEWRSERNWWQQRQRQLEHRQIRRCKSPVQFGPPQVRAT